MIFVKTLEFLPSLFFFKIGLDILSDDVLERKQGFLDHKNNFLILSKKWHFVKGVMSDVFCLLSNE